MKSPEMYLLASLAMLFVPIIPSGIVYLCIRLQVPEGGGMSREIEYRIVDREARQSGAAFVEAVIVRPSAEAKYWWIRHLENGEVVKSERFAEEPKARERWDEIRRSYAGGAA